MDTNCNTLRLGTGASTRPYAIAWNTLTDITKSMSRYTHAIAAVLRFSGYL